MTQEVLAKKIGFSRTSLSMLLNGTRRVGVKSAQKIAAYLGRVDDWRNYIMISPEQLRQALGLTSETNTD